MLDSGLVCVTSSSLPILNERRRSGSPMRREASPILLTILAVVVLANGCQCFEPVAPFSDAGGGDAATAQLTDGGTDATKPADAGADAGSARDGGAIGEDAGLDASVAPTDAGAVNLDSGSAFDGGTPPFDAGMSADSGSCGELGEHCCTGGSCLRGCCDPASFVCQSVGTPCDGGLVCTGANTCGPCGGNGQPCCAGGTCNGTGITCQGSLCQPCGAPGQGCCPGDLCSSGCCDLSVGACVVEGSLCGTNQICTGSGCASCGGPYEMICGGTNPCYGGACPAANNVFNAYEVCVPGGDDAPTNGSPSVCYFEAPSGDFWLCGDATAGAYLCCQSQTCTGTGECCVGGLCIAPGDACGDDLGTCTAGSCVSSSAACGGVGQACCTGTWADAAFCTSSDTVCVPSSAGTNQCATCGNPGQPCCDGNFCSNGGCCNDANVCVVPGTPCGDGVCTTAAPLVASCGGCGALGQLPCATSSNLWCSSPSTSPQTQPSGASLCAACGGVGEPCCPAPGGGGGYCGKPLFCLADGTCGCGENEQPCCANAVGYESCNFGACPATGVCLCGAKGQSCCGTVPGTWYCDPPLTCSGEGGTCG
jgi:hypothetical protein